jgi:hypothetical protein
MRDIEHGEVAGGGGQFRRLTDVSITFPGRAFERFCRGGGKRGDGFVFGNRA